ncbi:MAG: dihydroorotase [Clostridia bacterium]|nr:dihydroorotase [Clostridia bacterium]
MKDVLFQNAIVYYEGRLQRRDVLIVQGKIVSVDEGAAAPVGAAIVDAKNFYILPGFADIHVHLREPGFSYKETIATGTRAAAKGGFTLVCAMPNLDPVPDCPPALALQQKIIDETALIKVLPYASITKGQKGESLVDMQVLAKNCFAFSDDGSGIQQDSLMEQAMQEAKKYKKPIVAHCEDTRYIPENAVVHEGKYAKEHALTGIPSKSEYAQVQRDISLVEKTGCRYHVCHVSCRESVDAIRNAKKKGLPVSGETAAHYLAFCDEDLLDDGRFKMNPPIRSSMDQSALIEGIKDGTLEVIVTDHAPHSLQEKSLGLRGSKMGVVGLETSFAAINTYACRPGHISFSQLVELMSINPRKLFGLPYGINVGDNANLVIVDPERKVKVDARTFVSKGQATPFNGQTLYGDVLMTIFDGNIVYNNFTAF